MLNMNADKKCLSKHRLAYNIKFFNDISITRNNRILQTPSLDTKKPNIDERMTSNRIKYKTCV